MPNYTPNLNLVQPLGGEAYNISVPNGNMGIIDTAIKNLQDGTEIATQSEATNGTVNNKLMTPLRTNQAIVQNANVHYAPTVTGTANAKTANPAPAITNSSSGHVLNFKNNIQNTGNVTITLPINGTNTIFSLLNNDGTQIAPGDLKANSYYSAIMEGTNFFLIKGGGGESPSIKKVYRGNAQISTNQQSVTFVHPEGGWNVNKSIVKITTYPLLSSSEGRYFYVQANIVNSTTISLQRNTLNNTGLMCNIEVIEFEDNVNVQSGSSVLTNSQSSLDVTISSVNQEKSFLVFSHTINNSDSFNGSIGGHVFSDNVIRFNKFSSTSSANVRWFVVSF